MKLISYAPIITIKQQNKPKKAEFNNKDQKLTK